MLSRRALMGGTAGLVATAGTRGLGAHAAALDLERGLAAGVRQTATLEALPNKVPLIKLAYRPPNYETPISYFERPITPNDAFFVRYHLSDIPETSDPKLDPKTWRLKLAGESFDKPMELSFDELKAFDAVEITAICQCSGNRRGLFEPHVPGVQWGYGAMGNARWKGARLKDVLVRAGLKKDALEIVFDGADGPVVEKTPDFIKSIPAWKALEETVLLAYEMNGAPLPRFNGFPVRLIVPGWTGTYWVKHLTSIEAVAKPYQGFWMKGAYRIPTGKFPLVQRFLSQETDANTPITEMVVNSLITSPTDGALLPIGKEAQAKGIAWDGGYGIAAVEVSLDGGRTFDAALLGEDHGRFSFRPWLYQFKTTAKGPLTLVARARNSVGQTQTSELVANPAGYHHNLMPRVTVDVA
ncbi:MAG: molybdopterin-dependent oxidoreductase [Beijerinckiaceae bacterium]